jgi:hypothetical protein
VAPGRQPLDQWSSQAASSWPSLTAMDLSGRGTRREAITAIGRAQGPESTSLAPIASAAGSLLIRQGLKAPSQK